VSIERMRACACGEPSTLRCKAPGVAVSKVNGSVPVTTRRAAGGSTERPMSDAGRSSAPVEPRLRAPRGCAASVSGCSVTGALLASLDAASLDAASPAAATPAVIDSRMLRYPVQRQRLPFMSRGRSPSCSSSRVDAVTIMPAVQNPHWKPKWSTNAACMGWSSSGVPRPATVVTECPSMRCAG
jgi:hypothetical protein